MFSSLEIGKRIDALHTIEDIVSAMKAYAGVTIRKTEDIVPNIREYEKSIQLSMADLIIHYSDMSFERHEGAKRILVVFGSSQGLCGPYNEKIADTAMKISTDNDFLFVIGRRLKSTLDVRKVKYQDYSDSILSINGIQTALRETVEKIMHIYENQEYYNLTFLFTAISQNRAEISVEQILPPDIDKIRTLHMLKNPPLIYLEPETVFTEILEEFIYISLYRCYVESLRSENWYRLRSMEGASETLKKRVSELGSQQKYIRQEEITEEMLEILGSGMFYGS